MNTKSNGSVPMNSDNATVFILFLLIIKHDDQPGISNDPCVTVQLQLGSQYISQYLVL